MPKQGNISASRIKDMMTSGRGKNVTFGKTAHAYARQLAWERIGEEYPDYAYGNAIDWGNEYEYYAIQAYEKKNICEVHSQQVWQQHPKYEWIGGTPDGLVGTNGGMDAKCPYNLDNHMMNLFENAQLKDYRYQFQGYMWITGRKWWDMASFYPDCAEKFQLHVCRVERDDELIAKIEERYKEFETIIQQYIEKLKAI
jgi:predicted phage-related endonuclease